VQAVAFVVAGQLGPDAVSGLRGAQVAFIQPVQNFAQAVMGLLVPRASRLAHEASTAPAPAGRDTARAGLGRLIAVLALVFGALALVLVAVALPVAHLVLRHVAKFAYTAPIALPVSLQAAVYLLQIPFTAAMRAMHRARTLFAQYVVFTATSLTGLVVGAVHSGLGGAAWGLTAGAVVGFVTMVACYFDALRRLRRSGETPATDQDLAGVQAGLVGPDNDRRP
jgi:O-antigen/teichoic acid export membrane protein